MDSADWKEFKKFAATVSEKGAAGKEGPDTTEALPTPEEQEARRAQYEELEQRYESTYARGLRECHTAFTRAIHCPFAMQHV